MFKEIAEKRYSVRRFQNKPIDHNIINELLETAMLCPTSRNTQAQRVILQENNESAVKLKSCMKQPIEAPIYVIICYDETVSKQQVFKHLNGGLISAAAFAHYIMLAAPELNLGTLWMGAVDLALLQKKYNLPDYIVPVGVLALGYPDLENQPSQEHKQRKRIEEIILNKSLTLS